MRISDWSSDVCSSDLTFAAGGVGVIVGADDRRLDLAVGPDEIAEVACTFDVMILDEESERSLVHALDILDQADIHVDRDHRGFEGFDRDEDVVVPVGMVRRSEGWGRGEAGRVEMGGRPIDTHKKRTNS